MSPYERALETCYEIFGDKVKVEVHPIICEVFRYVCDIGHHLKEKKEKFKNYDFSHMEDHEELWFLEHLQPHHQETWKNHLEKHPPLDYSQKQTQMLTLLKDRIIYETAAELRERIWKVKQLLAEYSKKYKKIAIVSHYYVVRTLLSESFD